MKLKSPKNKGSRHERDVAEILRFYGFTAQRTPMSGAIENFKGDITTNAPLFIECKNTEKTHFLEWYKKAEDQSGSHPPVIVWTCNRNDIYAFLKFSDFMDLITHAIKPPKVKKEKKTMIDDTESFLFSKSKQARRPIKTTA